MRAKVNKQEVPRRVTSRRLSSDKHAEIETILLLMEFSNKLDLTSEKEACENHPTLFLVITKNAYPRPWLTVSELISVVGGIFTKKSKCYSTRKVARKKSYRIISVAPCLLGTQE